jgi:site-specific recombinase XerD
MPTIRSAVQRFRAYLQRRNYAAHTVDSYLLDLSLFFQEIDSSLRNISFHDVDRFIDQQHAQGLTPATINRRLYALKHFFDVLVEPQVVSLNPVKPSHMLRRGRPLPKLLAKEPLEQLFARIQHPMDRALFLLMLRCGLRVSEVAPLKVRDIDWTQHTVRIEQGKGRKDRQVYLSADALASLRECLKQRPASVPGDVVFWNQKRPSHALSIKAIQKKMARYAAAAGVVASCHRLRHTFASNLLEQGAEIVSIRELLGHASITSSERYAKVSNQKVKQVDVATMRKILRQSKV